MRSTIELKYDVLVLQSRWAPSWAVSMTIPTCCIDDTEMAGACRRCRFDHRVHFRIFQYSSVRVKSAIFPRSRSDVAALISGGPGPRGALATLSQYMLSSGMSTRLLYCVERSLISP